MAFMQPEVIRVRANDPEFLLVVSVARCDECHSEATEFNGLASGEGDLRCTACSPIEAGFYSRLQAPGYMDATDWTGPFRSAAEALRKCCEQYECDEDGNDLPEGD